MKGRSSRLEVIILRRSNVTLRHSFGFGQTCVRAWDYFFRQTRSFIGAPHIACLARIVGEPGLELVMHACQQHIEKKFKAL